MPKAKGFPLNIKRLSGEALADFEYNGRRVRGRATMEALVAFFVGEIADDSNLGTRASTPVTLKDFIDKTYLPLAAKPRLANPKSYDAEVDLITAVSEGLGKSFLHQIRTEDAAQLRSDWLSMGRANSTVKRRLNCLGRVMEHAVSLGLIKTAPLLHVKGLPSADRSKIWLRLPEIDRLLASSPDAIKTLVEFLLLTGARIGEALDVRAGDIRDGKVWLPTEKKRCPPREAMRSLNIASLGPRFERLLGVLKPHPISGFYFYANESKTTPFSDSWVGRLFNQARATAGLGKHITIHDLRGTFAMHRAMVLPNFRDLQGELGHGDPKAIQSYLDRAQQLSPEESLFYNPRKGESAR